MPQDLCVRSGAAAACGARVRRIGVRCLRRRRSGNRGAPRSIPAGARTARTIPFLMTLDETFDVGVDTRTGVNDKDYRVPFRFTGKIATRC